MSKIKYEYMSGTCVSTKIKHTKKLAFNTCIKTFIQLHWMDIASVQCPYCHFINFMLRTCDKNCRK